MERTLLSELSGQCAHRISLNTPRILQCLELISEDQLWSRPNPATNSIGNLILHLCGNMTQYVISSLGNTEDRRERDLEFSTRGGYTRDELKRKIGATTEEVLDVISRATEGDLLKTRSVQGFEYSGVGIIVHVTEHYSYHTGQIALLTKLFTRNDLGFYKGMDLNRRNVKIDQPSDK